MNDQTIKADDGKLRLTLVPREIIRAIARARMYGLKKYGDAESWRSVSVERYRDALFRHLLAYLDDPYGVDEESGLSHLDHLGFNAAVLCELESQKRREGGSNESKTVSPRNQRRKLRHPYAKHEMRRIKNAARRFRDSV